MVQTFGIQARGCTTVVLALRRLMQDHFIPGPPAVKTLCVKTTTKTVQNEQKKTKYIKVLVYI